MVKNLQVTQTTLKEAQEVVLELKNVYKIYGTGEAKTTALNDVSLSIKKQEFVMILGPSGSGKSTLLHLMGALDTPTKGKVLIDGIDLSSLTSNQLADIRLKKIGFVFQFFNLVPTLNAVENVELPLTLANIPKKMRREKAMNLLKMVGLEKRWNHYPSEMSGGEQQRVAIARALANDPVILLMDEPTGNVDSKTAKSIMETLTYLNRKAGKTIVLITHNIMLTKYATRKINILDGRIIEGEVKLDEVY